MPGLLEIDDDGLYNKKFVYAVAAELVGVLLFALLGGTAPAQWAPWANGFALAVLIYITANISGGHLNPAVTLATLITGHITIVKALLYILAQVVGAIVGHLLQAVLVPECSVGVTGASPGVFLPGVNVSSSQVFGWELILTFILVSTVYAVAIGQPSFCEMGPLAIGLSLFASATCAGHLTGAGLNPARVLGPAVVFNTGWDVAWVYVLAELLGGALAGLSAWPLYGTGPTHGIWHDVPEKHEEPAELREGLVHEQDGP